MIDLLNTLKHLSQIYHLFRIDKLNLIYLIDKLNGYIFKYLVDSFRITDTIIYNKLNFKVSDLTTQLFDHGAQLLEIDIKNNSKPIINKPIIKFGRQFSDENHKGFMKSPLKCP